MRTARSVQLGVSTSEGRGVVGVGPQVNEFEHVSSDDHQMSVAGGGRRSDVWGRGWRGRGKGK